MFVCVCVCVCVIVVVCMCLCVFAYKCMCVNIKGICTSNGKTSYYNIKSNLDFIIYRITGKKKFFKNVHLCISKVLAGSKKASSVFNVGEGLKFVRKDLVNPWYWNIPNFEVSYLSEVIMNTINKNEKSS